MFAMRDVLNGSTLTSLAESTRAAFQSVAAQVQTTWFKQHDRNGAHKDVTATSLRTASLGVDGVYTHTVGALVNDVIEVPSGYSFVEFIVPSALGTAFTLRGLQQRGVRFGHLMFLRSSALTTYATYLRSYGFALDGVAPIGTEFIFPAQQASPADARLFRMSGAGNGFECWVPFVYTPRADAGGTGTIGVWALLLTVSQGP